MLSRLLEKLENPERPLLGPTYKALTFWGLLLSQNVIKKYFHLLMYLTLITFVASEFVDLWLIKADMKRALNNVKSTLFSLITTFKLIVFLYGQKDWKAIIDYVTKADFAQRKSTNSKNINIINKYTKYCRILTYLYWSLLVVTIAMIVFVPVFKFILSPSYRANTRNGTEDYLQVISSWVPFDKSTFKGYLGAFVYQVCATICGIFFMLSFDTNAMAIMIFFRGELEMLRIDSSNIYGEENQLIDDTAALNRLKDCYRRHIELVKYAKLYDSYLSPLMFLYMFVCSLLLCFTSYQITIVTSVTERLLASQYLVTAITQLFIYCWHSNDVLYASQDLMLGPYESIWWASHSGRRKDLYILIEQFRTPIVFSAGPFAYLTVPTFIKILKGAYSYYTLLSNSHIN